MLIYLFYQASLNVSAYDFIFLDSVNKMGIAAEDLIRLKNTNSMKSFIFIFNQLRQELFGELILFSMTLMWLLKFLREEGLCKWGGLIREERWRCSNKFVGRFGGNHAAAKI